MYKLFTFKLPKVISFVEILIAANARADICSYFHTNHSNYGEINRCSQISKTRMDAFSFSANDACTKTLRQLAIETLKYIEIK